MTEKLQVKVSCTKNTGEYILVALGWVGISYRGFEVVGPNIRFTAPHTETQIYSTSMFHTQEGQKATQT
jgi:hypothetical protein